MLQTHSIQKSILISGFILFIMIDLLGQKNYTEISGTVPIDNFSSMDAKEITLTQWVLFIINNNFNSDLFPNPASVSNSTRLFFEDIKKQKDFEYIKLITNDRRVSKNYGPVGFKLTEKFNDFVAKDTNYFSIDIPIVGITFRQAQKFCAWRETVVNKHKSIKIKVALPSLDIYQKVNTNIDSLCSPSANCGACKSYTINYFHEKCIPAKSKKKDKLKIPFESHGQCLLMTDFCWPLNFELYNIQGNAAEMTSTEGIAFGGSFRHFARESYSDRTQIYKKEENWLGFRCFITLQ